MRRTTPLTTATAPVAVIGTIALSLTGSPAQAQADAPAERAPMRGLPAAATALDTFAASATTLARAAAAAKTHTVVRGDTVSAIASRHGLRTADVLAWNGLGWKSIIHPGDVLRLSPSEGSATMQRAKAESRSASSTSSDTRTGAAPAGATRTVAKGDTLWAIARSEGVGLARLLRANDLTTGSIIYPGQKLKIPGSATSAGAASPTSGTAASSGSPSGSSAKRVSLDAEQIRGVKTIIAVGRELGVPDKGIAIALATAMVESWIRNVDYGTHDSLGLFQQRPSMGWGSADEVRDPRRATAAFFGGPGDPNGSATRGLLDIDGWRDMEFGAAAQAVQVSAYPHRYGTWEAQAYEWLEAYG